MADHSYEEIRKGAIEILSGKIKTEYGANNFDHLSKERSILPKLNKFKQILDQHKGDL